MRPADLPGVRAKIYTERPCLVEMHFWDAIMFGSEPLLWLCLTCGRTPLEMLAQLPLPSERGEPDGEDRD